VEIEGIDRIVFGVRDMDRALAFFSGVLGVKFAELEGPITAAVGLRLAISFDKKLELISPVGTPQVLTNPPDPLELARRLEAAPGGAVLYALTLKVADVDAAVAHARRCGVRTTGQAFCVPHEPQLGIRNFTEVALEEADTFGIKVAFAGYLRC
jgi:catechol 2,3-dioxygenase-like lactoylglutathione lyase family enzyme